MTPINILLVDDNKVFLKTAVKYLKECGRNKIAVICQANGGREALAMAETLRPQAILIDLAMSDLTGLMLIPRLRKVLPEAALIALSLQDAKGYRTAAISAGADEFVSKSAMFSELMPAIQRVVFARTGNGEE